MKRATSALALGTGILAMAVLATAVAAADQQALLSKIEVRPDRSILSLALFDQERGSKPSATLGSRLVPLPPGTSQVEARVVSGGLAAEARLIPGSLRGLSVAAVELSGSAAEPVIVELHHDGNWAEGSRLRRYSRSFDAALGLSSSDRGADISQNGVYLVLTIPDYVDAVAPLVDWKRRKGLQVELVTTATTGPSKEEIQAWLRDAYENWAVPPEYLLIVGDTDNVPNWSFSGNVTDHQYSMMDDEDWLPDLIIGRMSAESSYQVEIIVNKTIRYEREPYFGGNPDWFKRYLGIAGNYGSQTPSTTVSFCGEQLESIGFENGYDPPPPYDDWYGDLDGVYFPPISLHDHTLPIVNASIEGGVSLVNYRGWAYFVDGWDFPHYTSLDIPSLDNGPMTPVVMSFVCLNGWFSYPNRPCFGEVWIRQGTPEEPRGAVAFIGNGEHWSHTRYNDAMAISFYERIVDPELLDLGQLTVAGRLRFMEYFPHELEYDTFGEESVEFYMHIYVLLGDPELNLWKDVPTALDVAHDTSLPAGSNFMELSVSEDGSGLPLAGARVGVVQGDELLACAWTDEAGEADLFFSSPAHAGEDLAVTVTAANRIPYEGTVSLDDSEAFLASAGYTVTEVVGNGDGLVGPGEILDVLVTLQNGGSLAATEVSAALTDLPGSVQVILGQASFPDVPAGGSAEAEQAFRVQLDGGVDDGLMLPVPLTASHGGIYSNLSALVLEVTGPSFSPLDVVLDGDGFADPGERVEVTVFVANEGHAPATGVTGALIFGDGSQGTMVDSSATFGDILQDSSSNNSGSPFIIELDDGLTPGTGVNFRLVLTTQDGAEQEAAISILAGRLNPALYVGPDSYGYYAYDSADLFWSEWPEYEWQELSTRYGGAGTKLEYAYDNHSIDPLELPFTFRYYGRDVDSVRVSDNGWIAFDTAGTLDFYNWDIPNAHGHHSVVAPFWDNLNPSTADSIPGDEFKDGVYYAYDSEAGTFTVEWSRMRNYRIEIPDLQTFSVTLFDPAVHPTTSGDGEILFLYRQVSNSDYLRGYATVGIEDPTETDGLQLSYSNVYTPGMAPLSSGLAVKLSTEAPVWDAFRLDGFEAEAGDEGMTLSWSSSDERPVLGWQVYRIEKGERVRIGGDLPPEIRTFVDAGADPSLDQEYQLTALHPYEQKSELGPFVTYAAGASALRLGLSQNLPNPMSDRTRIEYVLPESGPLSLKVYDPAGRLVRELLHGRAQAGTGTVHWDGRDESGRSVATGVYFYRLEARGEVLTRKLMVIR